MGVYVWGYNVCSLIPLSFNSLYICKNEIFSYNYFLFEQGKDVEMSSLT